MPTDAGRESVLDQALLDAAADRCWRVAVERLYHQRTSLFYDFISSYEPDHRFDHLPTPQEIARHQPNTNGWGRGMEDSVITGGVLLASLCDRFDATADPTRRADALRIYNGLRLCGTLSTAEGLVLRSVSPIDGRSYYIETSRDQLTHFCHGLWRYYCSALSTSQQRTEIEDMLAALCRRLERYIVPETDFHVCKENDQPGLVDKMWHVSPHEVGRLPMIYAVGWQVTGDGHWRALYLRYVAEALRQVQAIDPDSYERCYPLFQHQISMHVLASLPGGDGLQPSWRAEMIRLSRAVGDRFTRQFADYVPVDVTTVDMDWRTRPCHQHHLDSGYGRVPVWPEGMYATEFMPLRELGEGLLLKLMAADDPLTADEQRALAQALTAIDYDRISSVGIIYPQAAYWRYRAQAAHRPPSQP